MSDNHGNTPAAWTAVTVAMLGFVVGAVGLLLDPVELDDLLGRCRPRRRVAGDLRGDGEARLPRVRPLTVRPMTATAPPPAAPAAVEASRWQRIAGPARDDRRAGARHARAAPARPARRAARGATARARRSGIYCPGCGGLRAVNDLTDGDVGAAASSNLLFVVLLPLLVFLLGRWAVERWTGRVRQPNARRIADVPDRRSGSPRWSSPCCATSRRRLAGALTRPAEPVPRSRSGIRISDVAR